MKKPVAGEVLYARVPPGTKARIAAVRGLEREADWFRRVIEERLGADEERVSHKSPHKAPQPAKRSVLK